MDAQFRLLSKDSGLCKALVDSESRSNTRAHASSSRSSLFSISSGKSNRIRSRSRRSILINGGSSNSIRQS